MVIPRLAFNTNGVSFVVIVIPCVIIVLVVVVYIRSPANLPVLTEEKNGNGFPEVLFNSIFDALFPVQAFAVGAYNLLYTAVCVDYDRKNTYSFTNNFTCLFFS